MALSRLHNNYAFTLLELLFVLMIISLLTFISVPAIYKMYVNQQTKQFFAAFDADILYVQNQALGQTNQMDIFLDKDHYLIRYAKEPIYRRDYPKHITYISGSGSNKRLYFTRLGTVQDPRTFHFYANDVRFAVVFPLGKGRHYIEQR